MERSQDRRELNPPSTDEIVAKVVSRARTRLRRSFGSQQRSVSDRCLSAGLAAATLLDAHLREIAESDRDYENWFLTSNNRDIPADYALLQRQTGLYMNELVADAWFAGRTPPPRALALSELNATASVVAAEIWLLLRHGYPAGAEARWRTLHELGVTSRLLARRSQSLARRYLDSRFTDLHRAISKRGLMGPPSRRGPGEKRIAAEVERLARNAELQHGRELARDYGWAYPVIPKKRIRFLDIERAAGASRRRPAYGHASQLVHASRIGNLNTLKVPGFDGLWTGRNEEHFIGAAIRTTWGLEEIQYLFLQDVHKTTKDIEPAAWAECLTQIAFELDLEARRTAQWHQLREGRIDAAIDTAPAELTFAFALRDLAKPGPD